MHYYLFFVFLCGISGQLLSAYDEGSFSSLSALFPDILSVPDDFYVDARVNSPAEYDFDYHLNLIIEAFDKRDPNIETTIRQAIQRCPLLLQRHVRENKTLLDLALERENQVGARVILEEAIRCRGALDFLLGQNRDIKLLLERALDLSYTDAFQYIAAYAVVHNRLDGKEDGELKVKCMERDDLECFVALLPGGLSYRFIADNEADCEEVLWAIEHGAFRIFKHMVDGSDIISVLARETDDNLLHRAVVVPQAEEITHYLMDHYPNLKLQKNQQGEFFWHKAAQVGRASFICSLSSGSDIADPDNLGNTPFDYYLEYVIANIDKEGDLLHNLGQLIKHNPSVLVTFKLPEKSIEQTPLLRTVRSGNLKVATTLLKARRKLRPIFNEPLGQLVLKVATDASEHLVGLALSDDPAKAERIALWEVLKECLAESLPPEEDVDAPTTVASSVNSSRASSLVTNIEPAEMPLREPAIDTEKQRSRKRSSTASCVSNIAKRRATSTVMNCLGSAPNYFPHLTKLLEHATEEVPRTAFIEGPPTIGKKFHARRFLQQYAIPYFHMVVGQSGVSYSQVLAKLVEVRPESEYQAFIVDHLTPCIVDTSLLLRGLLAFVESNPTCLLFLCARDTSGIDRDILQRVGVHLKMGYPSSTERALIFSQLFSRLKRTESPTQELIQHSGELPVIALKNATGFVASSLEDTDDFLKKLQEHIACLKKMRQPSPMHH